MTQSKTRIHHVGRPRSDEARKAILESALKLVQGVSLADVTIKSIAKEAKVSRQTIYRWWGNRGEIVLEALLEISAARVSHSQEVSLRDGVRQFVRDTVEQAGIARQALAVVMVDAQLDLAFLEHFKSDFVEVRRSALLETFESEMERARLTDSEKQFVADMVYGPLWYRLLVGHAPLNQAFADQIAQSVHDWFLNRTGTAES